MLEVIPAHEAVFPEVLAVQAAGHAARQLVRDGVVVVGDAFHRNAEVEFSVHHVDGFADLYVGDVAHVDHRRIHAHAPENGAYLVPDHHEALVVFTAQVAVAVTDGDGGDAGGLLCHPVTAVADRLAGFHVVDVADGRFNFHDGLDGPRRGRGAHAVVAVEGEARAYHVEMAFGVRERACGAAAVADFGAQAFGFEHVDQPSKALDLDFGLGVPRHVGCGEVREHAFKMQVAQAEGRADVVEVLGIESVTVHAGIDGEVRLAGRSRFAQELVEAHGRADVRDGGGELEFHEVGKVGGCAWAEHQDGQVHSVLAKQHAFADMGDSQVVCTAELGGKGAGEAPVSVRIRLYGKQDFRCRGNLALDKLNVIAKCV